jgi:hypothetical protein
MPGTQLLWSVEQVGETAGQVWQCLSKNGKTAVAAIEKEVDAPKPLIDMAIGWLAREGKVDLKQAGKTVKVWLTE